MAQHTTSRRRSETWNAQNDGRHLVITKNREIRTVLIAYKTSHDIELKGLFNRGESKSNAVIEV